MTDEEKDLAQKLLEARTILANHWVATDVIVDLIKEKIKSCKILLYYSANPAIVERDIKAYETALFLIDVTEKKND